MTEKQQPQRDTFEVVNELARDSAGVTYLAEQRSTGRRVAVKLLTVDPQTVRSQFRPTVLLALLIPLAGVSFWLGTLNRGKPDVIEIPAQQEELEFPEAEEATTVAPVVPAEPEETMPEGLMREAFQPEAAKRAKLTHLSLTGTRVNFLAKPAASPETLTEPQSETSEKTPTPAAVDPAFFAAAKSGDTAELKRLLATGIPIDAEDLTGNTALMTAVFNRRVEAVRFLLTQKPDLTRRNRFGQAAADLAAGTPELEKLLRDAAGEGQRHAEHP